MKIFDSLESFTPIPKGFCPPTIDNASETLGKMVEDQAKFYYGGSGKNGKGIHPEIQKIIDKEQKAIIGNGFAVLYLIAVQLVATSKKAGYVVGSRGSVGSSLVAFLTDITEVNPLPPHYRCGNCGKVDFVSEINERIATKAFVDKADKADKSDKKAKTNKDETSDKDEVEEQPILEGCGPDLPERECCEDAMIRDGYDIPFEAFMGFDGTKVPDIDLNFAGEYQGRAMAEIEETFGKDHVFRAGTINTLQERNARGFVLKYEEGHMTNMRRAEIERLSGALTEVARTTGQHPGGIVIVPRDRQIHEFMPVQKPANSMDADFITTHYDFHSYDDVLVKVDVLGHDVPTQIRMLHELTGRDPMTVPIADPKVMSLFSSPDALGLSSSKLGCPVGSWGIPELGTPLLLTILSETRPSKVEELVRISGLSHGTGVWKGNAQDLIRDGVVKLSEVIATREDIMNYLVHHGVESLTAFQIMEKVRKGKELTSDDEGVMTKNNVPTWVIESCKKIQYLFPRAHAVAYVVMVLRIAWYKVYEPAAFYSVYLTTKVDDLELKVALGGLKAVNERLSELRQIQKEQGRNARKKDEDTIVVLMIVRELILRGVKMLPVHLEHSHSTQFRVEENAIRPPFVAVEGLGAKIAKKMSNVLENEDVISVQDLATQSGMTKTIVQRLKKLDAFGSLPESNQLQLF